MGRWFALARSVCGFALVAACCGASGAGGDEWRLRLNDPPPETGEALRRAADPAPSHTPFGTQGSRWWTLGATYAPDLEAATDVALFASLGTFVVHDFEVLADLSLWYFAQPGKDAVGINPGLNLRWHALGTHRSEEHSNGATWSMFVDAGVGVLVSSANVPDGGTGLNFTPKAGFGVTWRPGPDRPIYLAGLRWHHISNARIHGDTRNPDRDAPGFYAGVSFGF